MEWRDIAEKLNGDGNVTASRERFSTTETASKPIDENAVKEMFPGVAFSKNETAIYVPAKLCHSFPIRNAKGRGFFPNVLASSVHTVMDTLVDIEHEIADAGIGSRDNICGHIKAASFSIPDVELASSLVPEEAIPVYALYCLYGRHQQIPKIVEEYMTGKQKWATSMEVYHDWKDAALLYEGEAIPLQDAPSDMLECIERNGVKPYKGRELSVALGGEGGNVQFLGAALTMYPADKHGDILGMFAGRALEAASMKCCLPVSLGKFKKTEEADSFVDRKCTELASIQVIGTTDPDEIDGHTHPILTDGTILPVNGHDHHISTFILTPGTKPVWTGRTNVHYDYVRSSGDLDVSREVVHSHTFTVDLKAKLSKVYTVKETDTAESELASLATSNPEEFEVKLNEIADLLKRVDTQLAKSGTDGGDSVELASIRTDLEKLVKGEELKQLVATEIASKVEAGELVTKEDHEAAVAKTKDEVTKEFEEKAKQEEALASRLQQITDLGIDIEHELTEGVTIKSTVESFGYDEAGDKAFATQLGTLKLAAEAMKAAKEKEKGEVETASKPKPKAAFLVGGDTSSETGDTETASDPKPESKPKVGKNAITSV